MTTRPFRHALANTLTGGLVCALATTPASAATVGNGPSSDPSASLTGRYLVFTSAASNLVPGDTNGKADIFLARLTGTPFVPGSRDSCR